MAAAVSAVPGHVEMHLGSSHLYEPQYDMARAVLAGGKWATASSPELPDLPPWWLEHTLTLGRPPVDWAREPWLSYARALLAPTNKMAGEIMMGTTT
jgi:hypothetical protein